MISLRSIDAKDAAHRRDILTDALERTGPLDDEPAPAVTGLSAVLTVVSDLLGMKWASPGGAVSAGPGPDGGWTVHATLKGSHS